MFSKRSAMINDTTYRKLVKLMEDRKMDSVPFSQLLRSLDELELPRIERDFPERTIQKLMDEWTSIKSLLRLLLLDRLQLAKENQQLHSYVAQQHSEGPATTRESYGYSDNEYSPKTVRQTLMSTHDFNQMLSEEPPTARPNHRKRSSSFGSIVMEEGSLQSKKIGRIVPNFVKPSINF